MAADPFLTSFVRVQSDLREFRAQTEAGVRETVKEIEATGTAKINVASGLDPSRGLAGLRESLRDSELKIAIVNDLIRNGIREQEAFRAVTADVLAATTEQAAQQRIVNNLIAQGVSEQEALAAASGQAAQQTAASAGAFGGQGRAILGTIGRFTLYAAALQTAFQLQQALSQELRVTGSEASTTTGRLRNMAAAAVQFDIVGVFKAARQELTLTNEEIEREIELGKEALLLQAAQAFGTQKLAQQIRAVAQAREAAFTADAKARAALTPTRTDDLSILRSQAQAVKATLNSLPTPEQLSERIGQVKLRIATAASQNQHEILDALNSELGALERQLKEGQTLTVRKRAELRQQLVQLNAEIAGIQADQQAAIRERAAQIAQALRDSLGLREQRLQNSQLSADINGAEALSNEARERLIKFYVLQANNIFLTQQERENYRTKLLNSLADLKATTQTQADQARAERQSIREAGLQAKLTIAQINESATAADSATLALIDFYRNQSQDKNLTKAARQAAANQADILEAQLAADQRNRAEAAAAEAKDARLTAAQLREQSLIAAQTAAAATARLDDDRKATAALVAFYRGQSRNADLTAAARQEAAQKAKAAAQAGAIQIQDARLARLRERQAVRATALENLAAAAALTTTNQDDQRVLNQQAAFIKNSFRQIEALLLDMIRSTAVGSARRKQLQQILFQERQKANAALTQIDQQRIAVAGPDPLKLQKLETAKLRAQLTETSADDKAVLQQEIRLWQQAIKNTKLKGAARREFIEAATQEILRLRIAIKNLSDQTRGAFADISAFATLSNELLQKFLPNIQFDANGGISNLFGRGTGSTAPGSSPAGTSATPGGGGGVGVVSGAGRFVDALNQNTAALNAVKGGLGTTVDVDFNFTGDPDEGVDAKAAAARFAFLSAFDG